jgi:REP element-mobilizing transposase RayT
LFGEIENDKMILNDSGIIINKWWQKISEKFPDIELGDYQIMPNHFHAIVINNGVNLVGANPRVRPKIETSNTIIETSNVIMGQTHRSAPTISNAESTLGEHVEPILGEHVEPILGEHVEPILDEHVEPILGEHVEPILGELVEPILGEHTEPILGEHTEPILGEHTEPILGEHVEPILGEHTGSPLHWVVQWFKTMTTNEYIRGVKSLGWTPFNGKLWQRNYYEHIIRDERAYNNIANYIINNPAKWNDDKFNMN